MMNNSPQTHERYRVSVREYASFREQGYLVVRGLVPLNDVAELNTACCPSTSAFCCTRASLMC